MCVLCVLSSVVSGGGPDIVHTTHSGRTALVYLSSVLVLKTVAPPTGIWPTGIWVVSPGGVSPRLGRVNKRRKKERKKERERVRKISSLNIVK